MKLRYSSHALRQMNDRGVQQHEVEAVLADPHEEYPGTGHSVVNVREVDGRRVKVYFVRLSDDETLVATVAVRGE